MKNHDCRDALKLEKAYHLHNNRKAQMFSISNNNASQLSTFRLHVKSLVNQKQSAKMKMLPNFKMTEI